MFRKSLLALLAISAAAGLLFAPGCAREEEAGESAEAPKSVVVTEAETRSFEKRLTLQGNVEARDKVLVAPRIPGILMALHVDEGDAVVAGETLLLESDSVTVERALDIAQQDVKLARAQEKEAAANLAAIQAKMEKIALDHGRFSRLLEKGAVTPDAFERVDAEYKATQAGLDHARALIELSREQTAKAEAAARIAEKNLRDAAVHAPMSGVISHRMSEPGELGDPGKPVFVIETTQAIEVSLFVPAAYYVNVTPGQTKLRIHVEGTDLGLRTITYRSPTVQPQLRTFEVKCLITDPPDGVVPGQMAETEILLSERQGLGVPTGAIQERDGQSVVFVVDQGKARRVPVETGYVTGGWTEVTSGDIGEGAPVVSMGQFLINGGDSVRLSEDEEDA